MVNTDSGPPRPSADDVDALLKTTRDGVVFINERSLIVRLNPAAERMFGYGNDELLGQHVRVLMSEPHATKHDRYIQHYEQTGIRRAIGQFRIVTGMRKSGREFPVELSVTELPGPKARYGAFLRDISETVRLREELLRRERLATVDATAAMLAHELGNPLNNLFLHGQRIQRRLSNLETPDPRLLDALGHCLGEMSRLRRLVDDFRALASQEQLTIRSCDVAELALDVLTHHVAAQPTTSLRVERRIAPDLPSVLADSDKLRQVFLNLYTNAIEAMPQGGQLTLEIYEGPSQIIVEVQDTGTGIPSGLDVFEPFVTTKENGTGLGLAISTQIVATHHGTLSYENAVAAGTTFRVALPISSEQISSSDGY